MLAGISCNGLKILIISVIVILSVISFQAHLKNRRMGTTLSIVSLSTWSCHQLWSWNIVTYYNMSDYICTLIALRERSILKRIIKDMLWSDTVNCQYHIGNVKGTWTLTFNIFIQIDHPRHSDNKISLNSNDRLFFL